MYPLSRSHACPRGAPGPDSAPPRTACTRGARRGGLTHFLGGRARALCACGFAAAARGLSAEDWDGPVSGGADVLRGGGRCEGAADGAAVATCHNAHGTVHFPGHGRLSSALDRRRRYLGHVA
ncbi:hypothetical protein GGX14DRAFT_402559 [Mycena pura]|uniref:Uncharacterized protein n=1 Tax=Mycena pura TaxID=153505 RepID=A0AAD6UYF0_9AGAR|nr:hypothetical protein GGX14DRAFT_402559 [Mycena pura]